MTTIYMPGEGGVSQVKSCNNGASDTGRPEVTTNVDYFSNTLTASAPPGSAQARIREMEFFSLDETAAKQCLKNKPTSLEPKTEGG